MVRNQAIIGNLIIQHTQTMKSALRAKKAVKKETLHLLKNVRKADYSKYFRRPVDVQLYKCYDYYTKITYPMDITTIIVLTRPILTFLTG